MLQDVVTAVAKTIRPVPAAGEQPVVAFNPLGFPRAGALVTVPASIGNLGAYKSVRIGGEYVPIQIAADGSLLYQSPLPSLGYQVAYLSAQEPPVDAPPNVSSGGTQYTLQNELLSVTIDSAAQWSMVSVLDVANGSAEVLGGNANVLQIYADAFGTNYNFGCEPKAGGSFAPAGMPMTAGAASIIENGPLRWTVATTLDYTCGGKTYTYDLTYAVVAGEPFVRITVTGKAPVVDANNSTGYSLVTEFPLASDIASVTHGTTYHWSDIPQTFYWTGAPAFRATHDFVSATPAQSETPPLGAIYHGSIPPWGLMAGTAPTKSLYGCLLRNTAPIDWWYGYNEPSTGTDTSTNTQTYAFRVPTGLDPTGGGALAESRAFASPPIVAVPSGTMLAESASLAALIETGGATPVVTAFKAGDFDQTVTIVRVYDPSNIVGKTLTLDLTGFIAAQGAGGTYTVQVVTALEAQIEPVTERITGGTYSFRTQGAITTLQLTPANT